MAPRASWKGQLKLSLVTLPVRLYNATTSTSKITLNQLNRETNNRLRQQMIDPETGPVNRQDVVKGYEYEKGKYVLVEAEELDKIKLETDKTIDLIQFCDAAELNPLYLSSPYFLAPDGPMGEEAFRVIRDAMRKTNKVGIGRVVIANREHIVALQVWQQGFLLTTLRYANEVRSATPYFSEITEKEVRADQLSLAEQLIDNIAAPFDPSLFEDRYQDALLALVKAKIEGSEPVYAQEAEVGQVINLMEALKASVENMPKKKPAAQSVKSPKKSAAKTKKSKRA